MFKLPGKDSNLDKENQNLIVPRSKPLKNKQFIIPEDTGRTAGRTREISEADESDADLAALVAAWPTLPGPIKTAIRALVAAIG
jgi:hypothetical protein